MAADQSLAGLLEATRVRQLIGGGQPWWQELSRYSSLLEPGNVQGGLGARLAGAADPARRCAAVAWALLAARVRAGVAVGPARRLLAVTALGPVTLIVSPTKWTLHFGELAGVGTAVLTLFVVLWSPRLVASVERLRGPALVAVLGRSRARDDARAHRLQPVGLRLGVGRVLERHPAADRRACRWRDIALPVTIVGTLVLARRSWPCAGGRRAGVARVLAPGTLALVLVVAVIALEGGSFLKVTADRRGTFSYGSDSLAALRGDPCGLASDLAVETDPGAGVLPAGPPLDRAGGFPDV